MKDILTVGECARICKVAPRTVSKWFDSGRLRGYRIPGSQDRRIPRQSLIKFLRECKLTVPEELLDEDDMENHPKVVRFDSESWCMIYCLPNSDVVQMCSNIADQQTANTMAKALKDKGGHVFSVLPAGVLIASLVLAGKA